MPRKEYDWNEIFKKFLKNKREWRCFRCGALLAKDKILLGRIEIKCRKCNALNVLELNELDKVIDILRPALDNKTGK